MSTVDAGLSAVVRKSVATLATHFAIGGSNATLSPSATSGCKMNPGEKKRSCNHVCVKKCDAVCGPCLVETDAFCRCGMLVSGVRCHEHDLECLTFYRNCLQKKLVRLPCGHSQEVSCYAANVTPLLIECASPCGQRHSDCSHTCTDACKDCFVPHVETFGAGDANAAEQQQAEDDTPHENENNPPKISGGIFLHAPCKAPCARPLACGHTCTSPCSSICPPCARPCPERCDHYPNNGLYGGGGGGHHCGGGDRHTCGEPSKCTPCKEACRNKCPHSQCTKLCGDVCDRERCDLQCDAVLACGHRCRGICGEDCLKRCVHPDCKPMTDDEIFFGREMEEDALFIQLPCRHMFEVSDFDAFMENATDFTSKAVAYPRCPRCLVSIYPSGGVRRYKKDLMRVNKLVRAVKERVVKTQHQIQSQLETATKQVAKLANAVQDLPNFSHLPRLRLAMFSAKVFYDRVCGNDNHQGRRPPKNLQLTSAMCHRIKLVYVMYTTAVPASGIKRGIHAGPVAGDALVEKAVALLGQIPNNESVEEMTKAIEKPLVEFADEAFASSPDKSFSNLLSIVAAKRNASRGLSAQEKREIVEALASENEIR